ncbi:DUF4743 domain-containing protein [Pusillimonas sp. TS35]|uniref:NUDIX hydrolase n=1 Tax=Paracandidimonas lactea TaxID=2895524 RepID=UPI00136B76C6|nr:DUF4743 domain-containing protein [Paracandidimonas lactea]MYN12734.1 DUF4743 domain-containing protein [Pusillimonas sp. TS35]
MNSLPASALDGLAVRQRKLAPRIQQLPPIGCRPLTVAGRVAGWITARATDCLRGLPGVRIEHEAVRINAAPHERMRLDAVLERVATTLRDNDCLRAWRNELLDVYGEGRRLGVIERAAVRPLGLLTKAVHLNAWSSDGRLWVARRALTKGTDPGMWDTLVGGLASAAEDLDTSLLRESHEEAGLNAPDISRRGALRMVVRIHRRLPEGYQVEDVLVSDCVLADGIRPANQDGEVSDIRLVSVKELWSMIEADAFTREAEASILDSLMHRMPGRSAA